MKKNDMRNDKQKPEPVADVGESSFKQLQSGRELAEQRVKGMKGNHRGVWGVMLHAARWQEPLTPSACQFPYLEKCKAPLSS